MSLDAPHHDGSELYVLEHPQELGADAICPSACAPRGVAVDEVGLRYVRDGEPRRWRP